MIELTCEGCGEVYYGQKNQRFCTPNCRKNVIINKAWVKEKKVRKIKPSQRVNFGRI